MYGVTLTAVALMIVTGLFLSDDPGSNMPPACQRVSPMLAAYHQNELSPAERAEVEAHLKICPHCREAYNQIRGDQRHSAQLRATVSTAALSRVGAWEFFAYPSR